MNASKAENKSLKRVRLISPLGAFGAALIIFIGVSGGIYTGFALTQAKSPRTKDLRNATYVSLGDAFPDYDLLSVEDSTATRLSAIASHGPTILLFVNQECGACEVMSGFWNRKVLPKLDTAIQVILILDGATWSPHQTGSARLFEPRSRAMLTDRSEQWEIDGIRATPTLVGLDSRLKVKIVLSGFDERVTADLLNRIM